MSSGFLCSGVSYQCSDSIVTFSEKARPEGKADVTVPELSPTTKHACFLHSIHPDRPHPSCPLSQAPAMSSVCFLSTSVVPSAPQASSQALENLRTTAFLFLPPGPRSPGEDRALGSRQHLCPLGDSEAASVSAPVLKTNPNFTTL